MNEILKSLKIENLRNIVMGSTFFGGGGGGSQVKPYLRDKIPKTLSEIPDATAYEAGYLVTKNAGWRNVRPVIDKSRCVGCLQCYLY